MNYALIHCIHLYNVLGLCSEPIRLLHQTCADSADDPHVNTEFSRTFAQVGPTRMCS